MDTSRVDGVKAPPHDGTPRSRPVRDLIEHVEVASSFFVHLEAQRALAFFRNTVAHLLEQGVVLCYGSISVGRLVRGRLVQFRFLYQLWRRVLHGFESDSSLRDTATRLDLRRRLVADIRLALVDEFESHRIKHGKIVGSMRRHFWRPAHPLHVRRERPARSIKIEKETTPGIVC